MAKIQDKLFNRVIEGDLLELSDADKERAGLGGFVTLYLHKLVNGDALGLWLLSTDNEEITQSNRIEKYKKVIMLYGIAGDGITWKRIAPQELNRFGFNADGDINMDGFNSFPIVSDKVAKL